MVGFYEKPVDDPVKLLDVLGEFTDEWVYRGQPSRFPLQTSLERGLDNAGIDRKKAPEVEREMIRHFQRMHVQNDRGDVSSDMLYCLSLMQHHGAPTRVVDWTYSPFVAAYFALESALDQWSNESGADKNCAVWCLNQKWCSTQAKQVAGEELIEGRNRDETRSNKTFCDLYMHQPPFKLVFLENPLRLHMRLHLQQGVFLCPGDVSVSFEENLKGMGNWQEQTAIVKVVCRIEENSQLRDGFGKLRRMNILREILFPGLDGFAQSMKYRLPFYEKLAEWRSDKQESA